MDICMDALPTSTDRRVCSSRHQAQYQGGRVPIKHFLPGRAVSLHSTSRHSTKAAGDARMQTMGGAMYILAQRCAHGLAADLERLAMLPLQLLLPPTLSPTATDSISHCYLPPPPTATDGPATLNRRLRTLLDLQHRSVFPPRVHPITTYRLDHSCTTTILHHHHWRRRQHGSHAVTWPHSARLIPNNGTH